MKENEVIQSLLGECLAYRIYGQNINPLHVEDMITKAFEAGYRQGKEDSPKLIEMGELPTPPIYWE